MTKVQIAQQKRLREVLTHKLTFNLIDFKNKYFTDYCDFQVKQIAGKVSYAQSIIDNPERLVAINAERRHSYMSMQDFESRVRLGELKLSRIALLQHEFFNQAAEGFQVKLDNLISKLVQLNFDTRFLKVERVGSGAYDKFSILISNNDIEVEARFIYACGEIKAPHYRFIITSRSK